MIPRAILGFVSRLQQETDNGTVDWTYKDLSTGVLSCTSNTHSVVLSRVHDTDLDRTYYQVAIVGLRGAEITVHDDEHPDVEIMENLFSSAQISAGGLSEIEKQFFA